MGFLSLRGVGGQVGAGQVGVAGKSGAALSID
jgi:hypothetical protein